MCPGGHAAHLCKVGIFYKISKLRFPWADAYIWYSWNNVEVCTTAYAPNISQYCQMRDSVDTSGVVSDFWSNSQTI